MTTCTRSRGVIAPGGSPRTWPIAPRLLIALVLWVSWGAAPAAAAPSTGEDVAQTFAQANEAYRHGRWDAAAEGYRALVAKGVDDAEVWYDLGNAYAHMDDLGRARACYESGLRRAPRDADIRANLAWVTDRTVDKAPDDSVLASLAERFTLDELALAASAGWFAVAALFALWLRSRREGLVWAAAVALALLLISGGLFGLRAMQPPRAVVIPPEVTLFNGPGREYTASITLHAGARVDVLRKEGDWREIGALQHVRGWVRVEQLEPIEGGGG